MNYNDQDRLEDKLRFMTGDCTSPDSAYRDGYCAGFKEGYDKMNNDYKMLELEYEALKRIYNRALA